MKAPIVILTVMLFAGRVCAQANYPASLPAGSTYRVLDNNENDVRPVNLSPDKVLEISQTAKKQSIVDDIDATVRNIITKNVEGASDQLISGKSVDIATTIGSKVNIIDQRSVNVHVSYDARPIGGILNIRVELLPVFAGIGSAVRPAVSREFAEAVDNFDDEFIGQTILRLTKELSQDFAAKS